ncbi:hypothetical protein E3P98_02258 [Wallemia ichthyophaga]|nr:hypothetical protein E3P98_02258 [Wallemia ichthyophaga]
MIWHQLHSLSQVPHCTEVFLIGFWPEDTFTAFINQANEEFNGCFTVKYLREWQELGTAGGTYHFRDLITHNATAFFIIHSDIACDFPLNQLRAFHETHQGVGSIQATRVSRSSAHKYGCIVSDDKALAIHYAEKPDSFVSDLVSTGVYLFDVTLFDEIAAIIDCHYSSNIPQQEIGFDEHILRLEQDVIRPMADAHKMYVFETDVPWRPIKSAGSALPANELYLAQYQAKQGILLYQRGALDDASEKDSETEIVQPVTIDPSAHIARGCKIGPFVSIAANVVVKEGARVAHAVVQENTIIEPHCCILYAIIGARCRLAPWARVEGQPFTGDESAPTQSGICILACDVLVTRDVLIRSCIVLPNKSLSTSAASQVLLILCVIESCIPHSHALNVLVASSTTQLHLYTARDGRDGRDGLLALTLLGSIDVNGRILGIDRLRISGEAHDVLLLTLDHPSAQLVVLRVWEGDCGLEHKTECLKMLTHGASSSTTTTGTGTSPSHEYCNTLVDHSSQTGLSHLWQGQLHAFRLSYDQTHSRHIIDGRTTQIDWSVTLAMAFLAVEEGDRATLCRLVRAPDAPNPVIVVECLNQEGDGVDVSPPKLRIETSCPTASLLVSVCGGKRGVLVIGAFSCEYYDVPRVGDVDAEEGGESGKTRRRSKSKSKSKSHSSSTNIETTGATTPLQQIPNTSSHTPFATPTACTAATADGLAWVVGDARGDLYYLAITQSGLETHHLGTTSVASTLQHLGNGCFYVGSQCEDSKVVSVSVVHGAQPHLVELQSFTNLAPVSDLAVLYPDDTEKTQSQTQSHTQTQVVTCSGANKSGKLRVVSTGVGVRDVYLAPLELLGEDKTATPNTLTALHALHSLPNHLLFSYPTSTHIYTYPNALYGTLDELDGEQDKYKQLKKDVPTLATVQWGSRTVVYQSDSMFVFNMIGKLVSRRDMDVDGVYVDGHSRFTSARSPYVLVVMSDRVLLQCANNNDNDNLEHNDKDDDNDSDNDNDNDITFHERLIRKPHHSTVFAPLDDSHIAYATWEDSTVRVMRISGQCGQCGQGARDAQDAQDVQDGFVVCACSSPDNSHIYSLLAVDGVIIAGTALGNVFAFEYAQAAQTSHTSPGNTDTITNTPASHTATVGSTPVTLQRAASGAIFALCDVPSIVGVSVDMQRSVSVSVSGVNAPFIHAMTSYKCDSGSEKDGASEEEDMYVLAHTDSIRFCTIPSTQHTVHVRTIEMGVDIPRVLTHIPSHNMFAVGCVRTAYPSDRTVIEGGGGSSVRLFDDTLSPIETLQLQLEEGEVVSVVECLNVGREKKGEGEKHTVLAIGTYYINDSNGDDNGDGGDVDRGRFLLATVSHTPTHSHLDIVAQLAVPGCVYAVCELDGRIAIAVGHQVRLYEVELSRKCQLNLVASYGNAFVVVSLSAMHGVLVVADFLKSAIYLKLELRQRAETSELELVQVGYDAHTRWSSLVEAVEGVHGERGAQERHNNHFITLGADLRFNLFVLHYEQIGEEHRVSSREVAQLQENVSAICGRRQGASVSVNVNVSARDNYHNHALHTLAVYGTSAGSLCVLAEVDESSSAELVQMEKSARADGALVGQSAQSDIIDGDLISRNSKYSGYLKNSLFDLVSCPPALSSEQPTPQMSSQHARDDSDNESISSVASTAAPTVSKEGRRTDKTQFFEHQEYEFGGPCGVVAMMLGFPLLMYYFYICMQANDGWFLYPKSLAEVKPLGEYMWLYAQQHAYPTRKAWAIYCGLMAMQFALAVIMPGFHQKGLPVPSLKYKSLDYNCNAMLSFYATILIASVLHTTHTFRLTEIVDNFGGLMTVAILVGYAGSLAVYFLTVMFGHPLRMSGNFFYDLFMGASLNPRILGVDIKMWAEVRIPWVLLFGIAVSGACKQYDTFGTVSPNMAFMVLATGLYINACAKAEECIPQTWDMAWEKFGFMLCFWNFAGVPFTYCYPVLYLTNHHPSEYEWSLSTYAVLFGVLIASYSVFDLAMAQKSRFKMQQQGITKFRFGFPYIPGSTPDPATTRYIQTQHGSKLLISGPWAYCRKPNYLADWIQATSWGMSCGLPFIASPPIPHWYAVWFFIVLVHRCERDFERCAAKYGEDWEEYCRRVPYKFIPYVW